jgi:uncharacterized repeat protein (TIGR01451 family)
LPGQPITGGHIFNDANQNALRDSTEVILAGQTATMLPGGFLHISDSTGLYKFNCKINQQYQLKGVANFPYRRVTTPVVNVNYSGVGIVDTTHNIGMYIQPNVNDLMVRITPFVEARPGFNHHYNIAVRNEGTTIQNGNLVFYFDPSLIYQASQPAGTVSGYSISWPLTALNPLAGFNATADFIIPAAVPLGQRVKAGAYALGNTPDTTITDNHDTIQQIAVGSYDPNDKQVFPAQGISLEEVESGTGGFLEYLVRFQNTGTASAINVRVEDTLHAHLDLNTFELLGSSHTYRYVIENRVLNVYFDNINLPDSGASEKLSHGFFRYRIRATASISTASRLPNTAYIYFDFNAPVVTNTALTQVTSVFAVQPISQQLCTGEHLLLYAKASSPVISQQWYKDGLPTGITTDTLYIDSVSTATIGQYTFRISVGGNELISHVANVHVFGIPTPYTSVQLPGPNGANKADTLKFCNTANFSNQQFSVHGNNLQGSTIYNWAINGTVISSGPTNDLTLNYHVWHNGDRLVCYTIVPCSGYALADTIIFEMATTSEVQQVNIVPDTPHICPGQSVTFTTNSLHSDPYSTKWYKNGIQVSTYTSYTAYNLTTSDVIIVYQSNLQDAGCYVVPNPLDTTHVIIDSNAHLPTPSLNFYIPAPFCPGNAFTIGPNASNNGSNAQYQWQLNGQVVNTLGNSFSSDSFHIGDVVQYRIIRQTCGIDTFYSGMYTIAPDTNQRDATIIPHVQSNCEWVNFSVANGNNATSYLWKINGVTQNPYSSSGVTRVEGRADTIIVVVRFNNPCLPASLSDTLILPPFSKTHRQLLPLKPSNNPFCAAEQVTISNPNNFPQPQYYKNGVALNINYLGQVAIRDSVAYTITAVYPPTGCYLADTLSITLTPGEIPVTTAAITYTPGTICARQPVVFSINANGSFIYTVNWSAYKNDVLIGGSYGGTTFTLDTLVDSTTVYANVRLGCAGNVTIATAPVTLRLTEQIPTVDISASYPGLCNGNIANTFSADGFYLGSAPIYQWLKNGLPVGSNSYRYADSALQNNDKVYCKVTSNNPCIVSPFVVSDTLTMQTGTTVIPTVAITASAGTTCGQQPLTFTAQPVNGGASPVYQWFINNLQVTGATTNTFTHGNFTNGDLVTTTLISSAPCPVPPLVYSAPLNIQVITPQVPQISITGSSNMVCPGGILSYNASFTNAGANPQLQWIINSTGTNQGGTAFTTNALQFGDGVVCLLNTIGGCYEPTILVSNVILAAVYPGPDTPLITFSGGVYSCSPASAYQWYTNQTAVNGATAQTFTPLQTGQIQVEVTDSNGCKLLSPPYMLTAISAMVNDSYVHLSPNPAHNAVSLRVSSNYTGNEYTLTNMLGQVVATGHIQQNNTTINTSTFAPGFYQLRVGNVVKRLVKE